MDQIAGFCGFFAEKTRWFVISLCVIAALFTGCAPAIVSFLADPTPTATLLPTATSTLTPTATPTPSSTPTPTPTPTRLPLQLSVFVAPKAVQQGHIASIIVTTNQPVTVTGRLKDQQLPFIETAPGEYWSLAGIHALAEPGLWELDIQALDKMGREVREVATVEVIAGPYDSETIRLAPEIAALLDPELVQDELKKLQAIWNQFTPRRLWHGAWIRPGGKDTTSPFGTRRAYGGGPPNSYHAGQDFHAAEGDPVVAAAAGVVALAEPLHVRGNAVWIDHGLGVFSGYFHLSEILVKAGQTVQQGDLIGRVGSTGLSTGPHIHWEVRIHGIAVDPLEWTAREINPYAEKGRDQ